MSDPNDDLSSVADPGAMDPDTMTEPDNDLPGDLTGDEEHRTGRGAGVPGPAANSPSVQGTNPVGPPD